MLMFRYHTGSTFYQLNKKMHHYKGRCCIEDHNSVLRNRCTMKCALSLACVIALIRIICGVEVVDLNSSNGVQIITLNNHSMHLELENVKRILEADDIKHRHVVVVSIAGGLREGKSFLLNFFIRYLNAQVVLNSFFSLKIVFFCLFSLCAVPFL